MDEKGEKFRKELQVFDFMTEKREVSSDEIKQIKSQQKSQRYTGNKNSRAKVQKSIERRKQQLGKRIGMLALAGLLTAGVVAHTQSKPEPIGIKQAIEQGETPESLGLNQETVDKFQNINQSLSEDDLTNIELINMAPMINDVQFDIVKEKLSNVLDLPVGQITLNARDGEFGPSIDAGDDFYRRKDITDIIPSDSKFISSDIVRYIDEIVEMQDYMREVQNGDFDREDAIELYKSQMDDFDKLGAADMEYDGKSISIAYRTNEQYIDSQKSNDNKDYQEQEGYEPGE